MKLEYTYGCVCGSLSVDGVESINMDVNDFKAVIHKLVDREQDMAPSCLCPALPNIFRAFRACSLKDCRVIMVGQDPYPQKGVATGILFGNKQEVPENLLSPSLKVIKTAIGATENFDNTMLSWVKQEVLMINSALTCNVNQIGSHVDLWRPFVMKLVS